jgi:nitrogen regulatory protein PII-like uncharacterized protein
MNKQVIKPKTFTEHFGLLKNQEDLDFLNIYADQDMPLFLDPYGISAMGSKWGRECETQIASYFQYLIDSIKRGDRKTIEKLLGALREVNEISLGYSSNYPDGRGIGPKQAKEIQEAFENSEAAKSGDIKDLADCALLIPGINRDKISDITANILKKELILFTQKQCDLHSIPMRKVAVNNVFDYDNFMFTSFFTPLPVINERAKILLPLSSVRHDPELSKDKYYRNFVLEYLRAEHTHAGDSLATVLKNGRITVRIADLKKRYPMGTDLLYKFNKEHPEILDKYKAELRRSAINRTRAELKPQKKILTAAERIGILSGIIPGNNTADDFHKISYDNLIHIFGDRLSYPDSEVKINDGRKRIDIVFNNSDSKGFFHRLNSSNHVFCPKIFVECKNYGKEIGNPEIDQLLGRFSGKRGKFGLLLCRSIGDKRTMIQRCKDVLNDHNGHIIVLDDTDIALLLKLREANAEAAIDSFMTKKLDELIM